jgi:hypothetical protein
MTTNRKFYCDGHTYVEADYKKVDSFFEKHKWDDIKCKHTNELCRHSLGIMYRMHFSEYLLKELKNERLVP